MTKTITVSLLSPDFATAEIGRLPETMVVFRFNYVAVVLLLSPESATPLFVVALCCRRYTGHIMVCEAQNHHVPSSMLVMMVEWCRCCTARGKRKRSTLDLDENPPDVLVSEANPARGGGCKHDRMADLVPT
ncbi:hypothetical protein Tco_1063643 [Tanacetum coccineum]